jgi:hypothetical protein
LWAKNLSQEESKLVDPILQGAKTSFFYLKCYNLAIYVVKFFEENFTHHYKSLWQDSTIDSPLKNENFFMQFALEVAILECLFAKCTQSPLGVIALPMDILGCLPTRRTLFFALSQLSR